MIETTAEEWKNSLQKLQKVIDTKIPVLKDVLRIGAFRLICLPYTPEMRVKLDEWKKAQAEKIQKDTMDSKDDANEEEQAKKEVPEFGYDFTWDPLLVLMYQADKNLANTQMKPPEAFFVMTHC